MKKVSSMLNRVLVIDDVPVIAFGLLESFISLNKTVTVEYEATVFDALSCSNRATEQFDLLVVGVSPDGTFTSLWKVLAELKRRFGNPKLMLYASDYNHSIIEKMEQWDIDAYVHRFESMDEIQKAYKHISLHERYISELFYSLYNDYCLARNWMPPDSNLVSVSSPQKNILLLLCQGKDIQEIAYILHTPVNEITKHLNMFCSRLQC